MTWRRAYVSGGQTAGRLSSPSTAASSSAWGGPLRLLFGSRVLPLGLLSRCRVLPLRLLSGSCILSLRLLLRTIGGLSVASARARHIAPVITAHNWLLSGAIWSSAASPVRV